MWARLDDERRFIPLLDLSVVTRCFDRYVAFHQQGIFSNRVSLDWIWRVVLRSRGACIYCGKTEPPFAFDHLTPITRGGPFEIENLGLTCRRCNSKKTYKTAAEFGFPQYQRFQPSENLREFELLKNARRLTPTSSSRRKH